MRHGWGAKCGRGPGRPCLYEEGLAGRPGGTFPLPHCLRHVRYRRDGSAGGEDVVIRTAIQMLLGDTTKFLGVVLGVFLSTFLISHMLGMFNGMMKRTYGMISDIPQADVWVMD